MSVSQIEALANIKSPRGMNWVDDRSRSPKALGDMSGVILSRIGTNGVPQVQNFDYNLLSKFYICNDMVWTCINLISTTIALAKLKVRKVTPSGVKYLPDHPLQKMLDLSNSSMTQFDLLQSYVVHQLLFGNVTLLLLREEMQRQCPICIDQEISADCVHKLFYYADGPIAQIMTIHPSLIVKKIVGPTREELFFYRPDGINGLEYPIHPNNMLSDPMYNPDISWYGVSPTFMLKRWLDLDHVMTQQLTEFFESGSIPSMIVSMKPGANFNYDEEPETLVKKMKDSWMRQFSAKGDTQRSPAFVYGDIEVQRVQENIKETNGKEIYFEIENRVCATYGVPPSLYEMGLKSGSGRGTAAAQIEKDFYNRTLSKFLTRILSKINQIIVPSYNEKGLEVSWDLSELGMAAFLIDNKEARIERHWQQGLLKRDDTRIMLGYEPTGDEFGDDYYRITVMGDGVNPNTSNQLDKNLIVPTTSADDPIPTSDS